jgi:alkylation response protein AidB-like acyl-CoA dehydrogenase
MSALLEACAALAPTFKSAAALGDESRKVSADSVTALAATGAFKMLVPREYGGLECPPSEVIRVIEQVARADSALGWCLMVGVTSGLLSAWLPKDTGTALFGAKDVLACGVFAPSGEAAELPSGELRIRGRWAFASGCGHSTYRTLGVIMTRDGKPIMGPDGEVDLRHMVLDASDTRIVDTWDVSGLRGTGSHDLVVEDAVVKKDRAIKFIGAAPQVNTALYTFPPIGLLSLGVAAVCLGIAEEAVNELVSLARNKKPGGARRTMAEREMVQVQVGEAMASVHSARAFMHTTAEEVFAKATRDGAIQDQDKAALRLCATHATRSCARAVDLMYEASGATGIYKKSPLERHFRDIHVATQHAMVAPATYSLAGRIALGQPVERTSL